MKLIAGREAMAMMGFSHKVNSTRQREILKRAKIPIISEGGSGIRRFLFVEQEAVKEFVKSGKNVRERKLNPKPNGGAPVQAGLFDKTQVERLIEAVGNVWEWSESGVESMNMLCDKLDNLQAAVELNTEALSALKEALALRNERS